MTEVSRRAALLTAGLAALPVLGLMASGMAAAADDKPKALADLKTRLACNVESWYRDLPFMDRVRAAAADGFQAIEFWDAEDAGRDMSALAALTRELGLDIVQFTGFGHDLSLGDRDTHDAFAEKMKWAVEMADLLNAPMFTVVGHRNTSGSQATKVENTRRALERVVPILEDAGKMAILEPFNPVDHLNYFLYGSADGLAICRAIDSPMVKLNWDLYHMQMAEGNIITSLRDGIDQIGYVQVADIPGRNHPGTGELNYPNIFRALLDMGYTGPIGLECWPNVPDAEAVQEVIRNAV